MVGDVSGVASATGELRMTTHKKPIHRLKHCLALHMLLLSVAGAVSCTTVPTGDDAALNENADSEEQPQAATSNEATADTDIKSESGDLTQEIADDELGESTAPKKSNNDFAIPEKPQQTEAVVEQKQAPPSANPTEVSLTDIRYVAKKGGGTVVVETSAPATYHTREVPGQSQVVLEIANAQMPPRLKYPYITKDFNQPISSINAYQDPGSSTVRVVVQFKSPTHAEVKQNGLKIELAPADAMSEIEDSPTLGASVASGGGSSNEGSNSDAAVVRTERSNTDPRILPTSSIDTSPGSENLKFYGRPISIEVRDTPIRDVINLIAEQSGANIVLGSEVEGTITLKLRQIPWDEALLIVMKTKNLGYVRQGSILRVAPYEALQKETDAARKVVEAQKAAEPLRVRVIPVGYAKVVDLKIQIDPFLSIGRGKAVGDARTNSLVVTDTPEVLDRIANLVKALDLPPLQVLIEGKVVEARETFSRNLGIQWSTSGTGFNLGSQNVQLAPSVGATSPAYGSLGLQIGQSDIFGTIQATISLAETEDIAHVVSSPRVVALNNEPATIIQSTSIPLPVIQPVANGPSVTTIQYKPIEMRLEVTPQVTSENDVIMQIHIKREFITNRTASSTGDINARDATTRVLVRNGNTAVIGGVYQSDTSQTENGIPLLRSLPVIGWLFKNQATSKEKTELLVFLTPRILNAETSIQKDSTL